MIENVLEADGIVAGGLKRPGVTGRCHSQSYLTNDAGHFFSIFCITAVSKSIGIGTITVELFSAPTFVKV
jgi:hypothetical protein